MLLRKISGIINIIRFYIYRIHFGTHLRALGNIGLEVKGSATIGNDFRCIGGLMANPMGVNIGSYIRVGKDAILTIGDNVGMSSTVVWCDKSITMGDNIRIGARTVITDTDAHSLDYVQRRTWDTDEVNAKKAPIIIDDDVFIGTSCIICKGVHIGKGAVIGAGSVVTKDIPEGVIAAGNPCRVLKRM